jgi:hypothetical protein
MNVEQLLDHRIGAAHFVPAEARPGGDAPLNVADLDGVGVGQRHGRMFIAERPPHAAGAFVVEQAASKLIDFGGRKRQLDRHFKCSIAWKLRNRKGGESEKTQCVTC